MLVSLLVFIVAATMGGLNYVTTVLQLRTKGMTLMRMPLAIWGIFIASIMALLAFPALFVGGVMLLLDRTLGTSFFMPAILQFGQHLPHEGVALSYGSISSGTSGTPRFTSSSCPPWGSSLSWSRCTPGSPSSATA